ncbi:Other 1 protein kinase [Mycena sanguinolenta]|uniref:Other 1 protein kinase n=1 Tax=Mycena sanguinolenta TaxID=230812 RepID=A0A8H6XHN1_9AGAR|nr:Other 1 protein kinase [Mycena sanguinolenta]
MREERDIGYLSSEYGQEYEPQVLHIVVQEELRPITELRTAADVGEAFRGIFRCYRWLYEKARIIHRDISLSNLEDEGNGQDSAQGGLRLHERFRV